MVLRGTVDSLYLSFPGTILPEWDTRLRVCKEAAASIDENERSAAQVSLGDHLFEVSSKGSGLFAYVLTDNWFRIAVASSLSRQLPLCLCQVSSELLTSQGQEMAVKALFAVVGKLGAKGESPKVSRVDLCVDFVPGCDMNFENRAWVRRARKIYQFWDGSNFTGCVIGMGGDVLARVYDKTAEIKVSGKKYLHSIWATKGWDGMSPVWRVEFQFKRAFLVSMGLDLVTDVTAAYASLWAYAIQNWLRLTEPLPEDDNPSRWPIHPLWVELQGFNWGQDAHVEPLRRVRKDRAPFDDDLFTRGLGPITSFMAPEGIRDFEMGCRCFMEAAIQFHDSEAHFFTACFDAYIDQKVRLKMRRFNTFRVENPELEDRIKNSESVAARGYREAKDGE